MSAVIPLLAALLLAPHGAAAQWSANTVASYLAMFMFVASLFFGYIGMYDKNFFILLGNAFCVAGSVSRGWRVPRAAARRADVLHVPRAPS